MYSLELLHFERFYLEPSFLFVSRNDKYIVLKNYLSWATIFFSLVLWSCFLKLIHYDYFEVNVGVNCQITDRMYALQWDNMKNRYFEPGTCDFQIYLRVRASRLSTNFWWLSIVAYYDWFYVKNACSTEYLLKNLIHEYFMQIF